MAGRLVTIHFCGVHRDIETEWAMSLCDAAERERDLEEDLRIEAELNPPTEETHVEMEDAFWCEVYYGENYVG